MRRHLNHLLSLISTDLPNLGLGLREGELPENLGTRLVRELLMERVQKLDRLTETARVEHNKSDLNN